MKLQQILHFCCATVVALFVCPLQAGIYKNPVIAEDAPDPSVIRGNDGYYYLFSTAEHVYRSANLTKWTYLCQVFDGGTRPTFVEGVNTYWAPCVTKQDGRYVMYFALSTWGGGDTASIGVATATKPEGPYNIVGDGKLFTSAEVGVNNSIDPNYIEYRGSKYIVWGSWNGIWLIELTADGLAVKDINNKTQIAGTRFEAPYIYRRGHYFYLFCSIGACCEGANSTYETIVGRSRSLFGPYITKSGKKLMDNNYELFLTSNTPCIAPGHNSRIIEDEAGKTWMTYHGYIREKPNEGRVVWLDEVKWENDWPYIEGTGASSESLEGPVVTPYSLDVDEIHSEWGVNQGVLLPADVTNDGNMNLVVAGSKSDSQDAPKPWTAILQKNNKGVWREIQNNGLQAGTNPCVVPADFNGDGQLELLLLSSPHETANPEGTANGIYFIQSNGSFQKGEVSLDGADFSELTAAAVADFNRDGNLDILAAGPNGKNLVLLAPSSFDTSLSSDPDALDFHAIPLTGTDHTFSQLLTADFNSDGIADLFAYSTETAELFLGDGLGGFTSTNWLSTCPVPSDGGVSIADVNSDSALDIVCTADSPVLCINDGSGHFATTTVLDLDMKNGHVSTAAAQLFDWNGDNYADFFYQGESILLPAVTGAIWLGTSTGSLRRKYRYGAGVKATTAFMDWNGDGLADLLTSGTTSDEHLFPFSTGRLLSVTLNPNKKSSKLQPPAQMTSVVEGNKVHLSWTRGLKNQTYELFVRDDQGRLYGNVRAYIDEERSGIRKVQDHGNCGTALETVMTLPAGHYTWGVQRVNARLEGSAFRMGEFTISADGVQETKKTSTSIPSYFNALGQRVPSNHYGFLLIRYPDGHVKKSAYYR